MNNQKKDALKDMLYGTAGGASGAVATQFIDTIANVKQNYNLSYKDTFKLLQRQAFKNLAQDADIIDKAIAIVRRYNQGLSAKLFKIAPATGIAFGVRKYLSTRNN